MASIALNPAYRRIGVEEFLDMDFRGAKAELEDGLIYMMAGGSEAHARIATNIVSYLRPFLRGSGCRPYNSDIGVRTGERSVRYPDVSIYCNNPSAPEKRTRQLIGDPQVVIEVLSPSTSSIDQSAKLEEFRALSGVFEILFVDPVRERVRLVRRTAEEGWTDDWLDQGTDVPFPSLDVSIPYAEIFASD